MSPPPTVSIVIPCYNEGTLRETQRRVRQACLHYGGYECEILCVDDGSIDGTPALLRELQASDPQVRVVYLARNFGPQFAVTAGLAHAGGDAVAIMDADLQDPPEVIAEMLERWREGYEVVYGVRGRGAERRSLRERRHAARDQRAQDGWRSAQPA